MPLTPSPWLVHGDRHGAYEYTVPSEHQHVVGHHPQRTRALGDFSKGLELRDRANSNCTAPKCSVAGDKNVGCPCVSMFTARLHLPSSSTLLDLTLHNRKTR